MLTVLDAFDSIRWAMIFARWGQEHQINTLIEFFANLTRDHPNKISQIREYYKKTSWDLALHMRSGGTSGEGVDKIVQSPEKHDALACWLPADQSKGKGKEGKGFKGSYKDLGKDLGLGGFGKGKGRFFAPAYGSVQTLAHQPFPGAVHAPALLVVAAGALQIWSGLQVCSWTGESCAEHSAGGPACSWPIGTAQGARSAAPGDTCHDWRRQPLRCSVAWT